MNLPNWSCEKKYIARYETIISPYNSIFGKTLPINKQYWTMCGLCANESNTLLINSELDQLIKSKLITPQQFHGVEINDDRYIKNNNLNIKTNWYHGDLYETMISHKGFSPGIINVDSLWMPELGARYFSKILYMVDAKKINNIMLIWNCILESYCHRASLDDMRHELNKQVHFKKAFANGWKCDNHAYSYNGSGNSNKSKMASMVFYKK